MTPLQAALTAIDQHANPETPVLTAMARGLMVGYDHRWSGQRWETVSVESEYRLPIVNPETGRTSRTFDQAGKTDGIVRFDGKTFLMEHKTAGEDIEDPAAPYWRRLEIDAQVSGYVLANWQMGLKLDGTLYDVVRKPGIRPKKIAKAERTRCLTVGTYCGFGITATDKLYLAQCEEENERLFELRLIAELAENPNRYFARKTIYRMDAQILEHANELWDVADEIRLARLTDKHYRNTGSCVQWNRPCEYLGICSGHDTPESDRWQRKEKMHVELETVDGDGRGTLTNSRIQTFKTCRRKHFYRFELGIVRADKEEAEALYFGQLFHLGLAAWWSAHKPLLEANDGNCNGSGVNAALEHAGQAT